MLKLTAIYCLNEAGGRSQNEDAVWPEKGRATVRDRLFMVCDGVGGESYGQMASALVTQSFSTYFREHVDPAGSISQATIDQAQEFTMKTFGDFIAVHPETDRMSSTLTLIYAGAASVFIAWCGDSRIYHVRDGKVLYASADHSLVGELVRVGQLTPEQAAQHPRKNVILRSLQYKEPFSQIDTEEVTNIRDGDFFLLCSYGILESLTDPDLESLLASQPEEFDYARAIDERCKGKSRDNYSMYLLQLSNDK